MTGPAFCQPYARMLAAAGLPVVVSVVSVRPLPKLIAAVPTSAPVSAGASVGAATVPKLHCAIVMPHSPVPGGVAATPSVALAVSPVLVPLTESACVVLTYVPEAAAVTGMVIAQEPFAATVAPVTVIVAAGRLMLTTALPQPDTTGAGLPGIDRPAGSTSTKLTLPSVAGLPLPMLNVNDDCAPGAMAEGANRLPNVGAAGATICARRAPTA